MIRGWADANDYIIANSNEAMEKLQNGHYSQTPLAPYASHHDAHRSNVKRACIGQRHHDDGRATITTTRTGDR